MTDEVQPGPAPYAEGPATASDPGRINLDPARLRRLSPALFGAGGLLPWNRVRRTALKRHLWIGDSRAAVVLSVDPLLVACYSDDFDAVVLLRFDRRPTDVHLEVGTRLLTVNTFFRGEPVGDILRGPFASQGWSNVHPVVADFVCADQARVEQRKATIGAAEWQRAWQLGQQHLANRPGLARDGAPHRSGVPA